MIDKTSNRLISKDRTSRGKDSNGVRFFANIDILWMILANVSGSLLICFVWQICATLETIVAHRDTFQAVCGEESPFRGHVDALQLKKASDIEN